MKKYLYPTLNFIKHFYYNIVKILHYYIVCITNYDTTILYIYNIF